MSRCEQCRANLQFPTTRPTSIRTTTTTTALPPSATSSVVLESFVLVKPDVPMTTITDSNKLKSDLINLVPSQHQPHGPQHYYNQILCKECSSNLIIHLNRELNQIHRDLNLLNQFITNRTTTTTADTTVTVADTTKQTLINQIIKLKKVEKSAIQDLHNVEAERNDLNEQKSALDIEEAQLAQEEESFWKPHSEYLLKAATIKDDLQSLQTRYLHDSNQLDKLQKTNVYNDVFCIGQEGGLGTINGLRLGRLPTTLVEWPEINAAWGHTLLLLFTIARKYNFTFETYRLIPMASFSRVEKLAGDKAVYELYGSGDFQLNRLLLNRRFDQGMVAFLDCLRQLMEFVKTRDKSVVLPHMINHDRIGEVSIKLQFGSDEIWSRALRHVLLNLKILLAKVST